MEEEEKNSSDGDYAFDVEATPELKAPHQENDSSNVFQDLTVDGDDEIAEPDKSSCSSFAEEGDTTESPQKEAVPEVDDEDIDLDQGQDQDPKKIYGDTAPNTPSQLSETQATGAKQESEKNGTPTKSDSHGKGQDTDVFDTLSQDDASTNRDATKTSSRPAAVAQIPSASSSSRSKASSSVDAKNPEVDTANKRETDPNENEEASESGMRENGVSNMKDDGSIAEETPIAKVEEDAKENGRRESVLDKDVASSASSYSCEAPADDKAQDGTAANKTHSEDASEAQGGQGERVSNGNGGNEEEARDRRESVLDKEMPTDSESDSSYTSDSEASGEQTPMSTQRTAAETVPVGVVLPGDPHHSEKAWQTGGSPVDKQRFIAQLKEKNVSLHEAVAVITAQLQELFNRPSHEKAEKARQKVSDRRLKILEEEIRVQQQANKALEKRCKEATKRDKLEGKLSHTEEAAEELKRLNLKMKADQRDNEKKLKLFADPDSVVRAAYRGFKEETKVLKTQVERMERQRQQALAHADFQHKRLKQLEKEDTYPDVSAADMKRAADLSQKAAALDDEQEALEYRLAVLRRQKDTSKRFAEVQKAAEEKAEVDFLKKELKDLRKELGLRTEHSDASAAKARKRRSVNAASKASNKSQPKSRLFVAHEQRQSKKSEKPDDEVSTDDGYDDEAFEPSSSLPAQQQSSGNAGPHRGSGSTHSTTADNKILPAHDALPPKKQSLLFAQEDDGLPPLKVYE
eukprot:gene9199-14265_t